MPNCIYYSDNITVLQSLPSGSVDLIYIDPPFNSQKEQARKQIKTIRDPEGDRVGFKGTTYRTEAVGTKRYLDIFDDYESFIRPRMEEAYRVLAPNGSLYFHIDYREVHYCKVWLDQIFGRDCFMNEIIWAYDYGGKPKTKWPAKHDNILFYVKDPGHYTFNVDDVEREPYMAPGLVGPEKAARGKLPTDTWWHTIVATNGAEKTGYPTQKPLGVINRIVRASSNPGDLVMDFFAGSGTVGASCLALNRIVRASSNPGDLVMDFFAGSGTVGASCLALNRQFILMDNNIEAMEVMAKRFAGVEGIEWINFCPPEPGSELSSL